jgi:hypothetical protein
MCALLPRKSDPEAVQNNTITEVTRRSIVDLLTLSHQWSGALNEDDFLARLYDLDNMPSTDYRAEFNTAKKDIWKHRVVNSDWSDGWVFTDSRFNLLHASDAEFVRFLCETIHPIVRPPTDEALKMAEEFNSCLLIDGWKISVVKEISGKPVFAGRQLADVSSLHLDQAKAVAQKLTGQYIQQQVKRMEESIDKDPELAIGTAKEFLETLCATILSERGIPVDKDIHLPALVKLTVSQLKVLPDEVSNIPHAEKTVSVLLNNLMSIAQRLAELRNAFGTGHGKSTEYVGLRKHHARLAVGAAATLAAFLFDCHQGAN